MKGLQKTTKLLIYLMVILLCVTCSKDKEGEEKPEEAQTIQSVEEDIVDLLPEGLVNSSDEMAQSAVDYIESATGWWSSYSYFLEPPEEAQLITLKSSSSTNVKTYKWTYHYLNQPFTLYWEYSEDGSKRYWNVDIQLSDGPKYEYIRAWESKTGIQGELKFNLKFACVYDETIENCEEKYYYKYTWNKDASGNYNFIFIMESDDDAHPEYLKYEAVVKADGSGEIDYYLSGALFYHINWDTLGNGSWVMYTGGIEFGSGSWTVT